MSESNAPRQFVWRLLSALALCAAFGASLSCAFAYGWWIARSAPKESSPMFQQVDPPKGLGMCINCKVGVPLPSPPGQPPAACECRKRHPVVAIVRQQQNPGIIGAGPASLQMSVNYAPTVVPANYWCGEYEARLDVL